jgi:hypothetical protein
MRSKPQRSQWAHIIIAIIIGMVAMGICYWARQRVFPGPGDFNWALETAKALVAGRDPYDFEPSALKVPYPLPVALFGAPFITLPPSFAAALFFGCTSGLLAFGILRSDKPWRLLVFLSFPYLYALIFAQWSPFVMAAWFFPQLAPLLVTIKPHIALPVALATRNKIGVVIAAIVILISLLIYPTWPLRWLGMTRDFEYVIPLLLLPIGPALLCALIRWREPKAQLLLCMAALPFRGAYDLVCLYLLPNNATQMTIFFILSWIVPAIKMDVGAAIQTEWPIWFMFLPGLVCVLFPAVGAKKSGMIPAQIPPQESTV